MTSLASTLFICWLDFKHSIDCIGLLLLKLWLLTLVIALFKLNLVPCGDLYHANKVRAAFPYSVWKRRRLAEFWAVRWEVGTPAFWGAPEQALNIKLRYKKALESKGAGVGLAITTRSLPPSYNFRWVLVSSTVSTGAWFWPNHTGWLCHNMWRYSIWERSMFLRE